MSRFLIAGGGRDQGHRHCDKEHQSRENNAAAKAVRQHSYRNAGQRTQQNRYCDQKGGLCGREMKLLAKLWGEGTDEAPCGEAHRERHGAEQQMLTLCRLRFSASMLIGKPFADCMPRSQ